MNGRRHDDIARRRSGLNNSGTALRANNTPAAAKHNHIQATVCKFHSFLVRLQGVTGVSK